MPRQADPELEQRILDAACRLWGRGGEKALTMRAVAKAACTTTPTIYERYRDREDILRALRLKTRDELFSAIRGSHTLRHACERYLQFALRHPHAYGVLFDGVARPPSLHEPWPSFNFFRNRLAERLGGTPREYTRLMLSLWSLMHGTALLIIDGDFTGRLRTQMIHACLDAFEALVREKGLIGRVRSGPAWPAGLVLGEGSDSKIFLRRRKRQRVN
ncbi:MAG TPA: TetR/AcrR family transcriptional regulator [Candidatus Aquilonibacter sp.]|nr:TetR/AcrR family transcriptional regulator [Candidatus Aquilonibacter sp.]